MLNFFFSPKGRITRWQFWQGTLAQLLFLGPTLAVLSQTADSNSVGTALRWAEDAIVLWTAFCLSSKRLHDRGKSEWFFLLAFLPPGAVWHFIECGFLRGEPGPNAYGPAPGTVSAASAGPLDGTGSLFGGGAAKVISRITIEMPAKAVRAASARARKSAPQSAAFKSPAPHMPAASDLRFPERKPTIAPLFGWRR